MLHLVAVVLAALVLDSLPAFLFVCAAALGPLAPGLGPAVDLAVSGFELEPQLLAGACGLLALVACLLLPTAASPAKGWKRTPASREIAAAAAKALNE